MINSHLIGRRNPCLRELCSSKLRQKWPLSRGPSFRKDVFSWIVLMYELVVGLDAGTYPLVRFASDAKQRPYVFLTSSRPE